MAVAALIASIVVLRKVRQQQRQLEREVDRGKEEFDRVVAAELEQRTEELSHILARSRADAMSLLADEERRIAEERRRDVAERERDASARLGEQLVDRATRGRRSASATGRPTSRSCRKDLPTS